MNATQYDVLTRYEREAIEIDDAAWELIRATTEVPTAELVADIPADIVERIRERAKLPKNTNWCHAASKSADEEQRELRPWLRGLALWREYFGYMN